MCFIIAVVDNPTVCFAKMEAVQNYMPFIMLA